MYISIPSVFLVPARGQKRVMDLLTVVMDGGEIPHGCWETYLLQEYFHKSIFPVLNKQVF